VVGSRASSGAAGPGSGLATCHTCSPWRGSHRSGGGSVRQLAAGEILSVADPASWALQRAWWWLAGHPLLPPGGFPHCPTVVVFFGNGGWLLRTRQRACGRWWPPLPVEGFDRWAEAWGC
jgi:hypothetical protein